MTKHGFEAVYDDDGTALGYVERTGGQAFGWFAYDLSWHCVGEATTSEDACRILTGGTYS